MEYEKWELEIYRQETGAEPFMDWIDSLSPTVSNRILARLNRVRLGNFGDSKAIGKGLYELKFMIGPGYRIYYGRIGKRIVLLLTGGDKSSQKADIKKAYEYWEDYRNG